MSDTEAERTEEATPKRRDEAREEGRIPKSAELTIAVSLLGCAVVLNSVAPATGRGLFAIMGHGLASIGSVSLDPGSATTMLRETAIRGFSAMIGLVVALTGASFAMAALQARGVISLKPIMP